MKKILFISLALFAETSYAQCGQKVFSCTFANDKQVEVCDHSGKITYRFGKKLTQPELQFTLPHNKTATMQWQGMGSWDYDDLRLNNKGVTYLIFRGYNKIEPAPDKQIEAGIEVIIKKKTVAKLLCQKHTLDERLYDLDHLPPVPEEDW